MIFMKKKSASKKRNQQLKEEIEGLNKTIANMKDSHHEEMKTIREMIGKSYSRWLYHVTTSDVYKQTQREHPLLQWGQPERLHAIKGYRLPPKGYPNGRLGWIADSLYFASRNGIGRESYYFYKDFAKMGLLVGVDEYDYDDQWVNRMPTAWEVSFITEANEKNVRKWQTVDEEERKKIIAKLERRHGNNT